MQPSRILFEGAFLMQQIDAYLQHRSCPMKGLLRPNSKCLLLTKKIMNKKILTLIAGILSLIVFISFMTESGPQSLFGMEVSIWVKRLMWLFLSISFLWRYYEMRKAE